MSIRLTSLVLSLSVYSLASSQCLPGEIYYSRKNVCYYFASSMGLSEYKSHSVARTFCNSRIGGGDLASIHDADQNEFINRERGYTNGQLYWTGGEYVNSKWEWLDGSPWNYTNWSPDEPSNPLMFTLMDSNSGYWRSFSDDQDDNIAPFVCAGPPVSTAPTTPVPSTTVAVTCSPTTTECPKYNCPTTLPSIPPSTTCPSSWTYYSGTDSCYTEFFTASWDSAEELCGEVGGHLTSIHSSGENAFVAKLTRTSLNATLPLQMTWTGLNYESGLWRWSDSSPVDFINWASKEPTNPSQKKCAMISQDGSTQTWFTADCGAHMRAFVCKKRAVH